MGSPNTPQMNQCVFPGVTLPAESVCSTAAYLPGAQRGLLAPLVVSASWEAAIEGGSQSAQS